MNMTVGAAFRENEREMMPPLQPANSPHAVPNLQSAFTGASNSNSNNNTFTLTPVAPELSSQPTDRHLADNVISVGMTLRHPDPNQKTNMMSEAGSAAMKQMGEFTGAVSELLGGSKADNNDMAPAPQPMQPRPQANTFAFA